jgi:hypothetical protein
MCELAIQYGIDFSDLVTALPNYFPMEENRYTTQLTNGYYLYAALNADEVLKICRAIGDVMDLEEGRDWQPLYTTYDKPVE